MRERLDRIVNAIRARRGPGECTAFDLAVMEGPLWLKHRPGRPRLHGWSIYFDHTAPLAQQHADVRRMVALFLLRERGLGETDEALDYLTRELARVVEGAELPALSPSGSDADASRGVHEHPQPR